MVANGDTSSLHGTWIASDSTEAVGFGPGRHRPTSISGWVSGEPGRALCVCLGGVASSIDEADVAAVAERARAEFARVAAMQEGDPDLSSLKSRAASVVAQQLRESRDFLQKPPRLGVRGVHDQWLDHLNDCARCSQADPPPASGAAAPSSPRTVRISYCAEAAQLTEILEAPGNPWAERIRAWGIADRLPVAVATRADPAFAAQLEKEREERLEQFALGLEERFVGPAAAVADTADASAKAERRRAALEAFSEEYESATRELEDAAAAASADPPPLADDPPLTNDPQLHADSETLALPGGGSLLLGRFPGMTGGHVGVALSLGGLPRRLWIALPGLSAAIRNSGIAARRGREALSYSDLCEQLQREVLYADVTLTFSRQKKHVEVLARAAGLSAEEAVGSVSWLEDRLTCPSLSASELPRLRDAIGKAHQSARKALEQRGEFWVDSLAQDSAALAEALQGGCEASQLQLVAGCSATRTHALLRLKWRLKEPPAGAGAAEAARGFLRRLKEVPTEHQDRRELQAALETLAAAAAPAAATEEGGAAAAAVAAAAAADAASEAAATFIALVPGTSLEGRTVSLIDFVGELPSEAKAIASQAIDDLSGALSCSSDVRFPADWVSVVADMEADFDAPATDVLEDWREILRFACRRSRARAWASAGPQLAAPLAGALRAAVARFPAADAPPAQGAAGHSGGLAAMGLRLLLAPFSSSGSADDRACAAAVSAFAATTPLPPRRRPGQPPPWLVGIVHPSLSAGAVVSMSGCVHESADPQTWTTDSLLDALALTQFAGAGAHSLFIRTWAAGLAYGNGVALSTSSGRYHYYADTCNDVAKTLAFVAAEVRKDLEAGPKPALVDYALAQLFSSRAGTDTPEARTEAAARDEANGCGPERVRALRGALLELRRAHPGGLRGIAEEMHSRAGRVLGRVVPGVDTTAATASGGGGAAARLIVIAPAAHLDGVDAYLSTVVPAAAAEQGGGGGAGETKLLRLHQRDFWLLQGFRPPAAPRRLQAPAPAAGGVVQPAVAAAGGVRAAAAGAPSGGWGVGGVSRALGARGRQQLRALGRGIGSAAARGAAGAGGGLRGIVTRAAAGSRNAAAWKETAIDGLLLSVAVAAAVSLRRGAGVVGAGNRGAAGRLA